MELDLTANYPRKIKMQRINMAVIQIAVLLLVIPGIYGTFGWLGVGCWAGLGYLAQLTRKRIAELQRAHAILIMHNVQDMVANLRADLEKEDAERKHEHD